MANKDDILMYQDGNANVNEDELLRYVSGQLTPQEQQAFEERTMNSDFMNDALEGLSAFQSKEKLSEQAARINHTLHHQLNERKRTRNKRRLQDISLPVIAVVVILLLCVLAFTVLYLMR